MSARAAAFRHINIYDEPGENPHSAVYRTGAGMNGLPGHTNFVACCSRPVTGFEASNIF